MAISDGHGSDSHPHSEIGSHNVESSIEIYRSATSDAPINPKIFISQTLDLWRKNVLNHSRSIVGSNSPSTSGSNYTHLVEPPCGSP